MERFFFLKMLGSSWYSPGRRSASNVQVETRMTKSFESVHSVNSVPQQL